MSDLRTQLQSYIEANVERVDIDDVIATLPNQPVVDRKPRWRSRPVWMFAFSAVAVVVLIGGIAWLTGDTGSEIANQPEIADHLEPAVVPLAEVQGLAGSGNMLWAWDAAGGIAGLLDG